MEIRNKYVDYTVSIILLFAGTFLMALGFSLFLVPIQIAPGGFSGLASLIVFSLKGIGITFVPTGMLTLAMNIPLYLLAIKKLGGRFGLYSVIGVILFTVFIDVVALFEPLLNIDTSDKMLSAVYGGVIMGLGLGLVIRIGGSTGGSDMLSIVISNRFPTVSVGTVIMVVDGLVVALSIFIYGLNSALYAFIAIFLSTVLVDYVLEGTRAAKAYYIISNASEEIAENVLLKINRGVTALKAKGMYTKHDKNVLLCLVTRTQVAELRRIVHAIDPTAFMFSTSVKEVIGEGFVKEEQTKITLKKKTK